MLHVVEKTESITLGWNKDSKRTAVITTKEGKFIDCRFNGVGNTYDSDDWEFLGELAEYIKKIGE